MQYQNKFNQINDLTANAAAQSLMTAIEAEIKLARYWLKQTVKNYRAWRQQDAHPAPARDLLHTDQTVRQLVSRMLREYRRKQKLLGEMKLGQSHWGKADVEYFRHVNHYGPAIAAHFANDNVVH